MAFIYFHAMVCTMVHASCAASAYVYLHCNMHMNSMSMSMQELSLVLYLPLYGARHLPDSYIVNGRLVCPSGGLRHAPPRLLHAPDVRARPFGQLGQVRLLVLPREVS